MAIFDIVSCQSGCHRWIIETDAMGLRFRQLGVIDVEKAIIAVADKDRIPVETGGRENIDFMENLRLALITLKFPSWRLVPSKRGHIFHRWKSPRQSAPILN